MRNPKINILFFGNLNLGVFSRISKLFANPIMKIVIEPSVINKPDNKNIRRGSLKFFMKKAAAIAPINDPALKAA